jgi:hypothetical protein
VLSLPKGKLSESSTPSDDKPNIFKLKPPQRNPRITAQNSLTWPLPTTEPQFIAIRKHGRLLFTQSSFHAHGEITGNQASDDCSHWPAGYCGRIVARSRARRGCSNW